MKNFYICDNCIECNKEICEDCIYSQTTCKECAKDKTDDELSKRFDDDE